MLELKKNNRNIPALPIAAAIVVRLSALQQTQPQSLNDAGGGGSHHSTAAAAAAAAAAGFIKDDTSPFLNSIGTGVNNHNSNNNNNNNFGSSSSHPWESSTHQQCPALHPMMSEAARRDTFASWPHMDYRLANRFVMYLSAINESQIISINI